MENSNGRQNFNISLDLDQLRSDAAAASGMFRDISQSAVSEGALIDKTFKAIAATIGGMFAVNGLREFLSKVVEVRGEIQSLEVSFRTLLGGNKDMADAMFGEIRRFAVQTPMMLKDLASGAQTMLAFNIEVEKVMPILRSIGDISMGDAQKFNSLTLAFSQMSATGKLMGQDLLQMINAGFNPLSEISTKTGKSIGELKEEMEKGKISTDMVTEAFLSATAAGGKFHGMLQSQSVGSQGAISNLQGAIEDMFNGIGTKLEGVTVGAINDVTGLVNNYEEVGEAVLALIAILGTYKAALVLNEATVAAVATANEAHLASIAKLEAAEISQFEVELKSAVAKRQLTSAQAEAILTEHKAAQARVAGMQALAAQARAEISTATAAEAAANKRYLASVADLKAASQRLVAAKASGDMFAIEAANANLSAAAQERDAAAKELNAATTATSAATKRANVAATEAEAAATALSTATVQTETTATSLLTTAKATLQKGVRSLYATMTAHPYAMLAAAIIALGYAIYKVATYETDAEKAQRKLNEAVSESEASISTETAKVDALFASLNATTKGTKEYEEAKKRIIDQYGKYLEGLVNEKGELDNVAAAYERITVAAKEAARARALDSYTKDAAETHDKKIKETLESISKTIRGKVDDADLAGTLIELVNSDLRNGGSLSRSTIDALYKNFGTERAKNGKWTKNSSVESIIDDAADYREAGKIFAESVKQAEQTFGGGVNEFLNYTREELISAKNALLEDLEDNAVQSFTILGGGRIMKDVNSREEALLALNRIKGAIAEKSETAKAVKTEAEYSKKDWEDALKAKNAEWEAMTKVERESAKGKALKAEIIRLTKEVKDASASSIDKDSSRGQSVAEQNSKLLASEAERRKKEEEQYSRQLAQQAKDSEFDIQQAKIDAMKDGIEKQLAQNKLNYDRLQEQNRRREQQMLDELAETQLRTEETDDPTLFMKKDKDGKMTVDSVKRDERLRAIRLSLTIDKLSPAQQKTLKEFGEIAALSFTESNKAALSSMIEQYGTYQQKLSELEDKYQSERASFFDKDGQLLPGVTQANIDNFEKAYEKLRMELMVENEKLEGSWRKIFSDPSKMTKAQLDEAIVAARKLVQTLSQKPDVLPDQLKAAADQLKALEDERDKIDFEGWDAGLQKCVKRMAEIFNLERRIAEKKAEKKDTKTEEEQLERQKAALKNALAATGVDIFTDTLAQAAAHMKELADITGDVELADKAEQLAAFSQNLKAAADGMQGGSGWGALAGGLTDIVNQIIGGFSQADLWVAQLQHDLMEFRRQIRMTKYEISDEDWDGLFGTSSIARAIDAYEKAQDALAAYHNFVEAKYHKFLSIRDTKQAPDDTGIMWNPYAGWSMDEAELRGLTNLQAMRVKTKDYGAFLNFFGKKDEYANLVDIAPELWDENNEFNVENARKFLETTNQLTQAQRDQIQNAIDLKDAYDEAMQVIDDLLTENFSNVADSLTDAIYDSIVNGSDAWEQFQKIGHSTIAALGRELVKNILIDEYLNGYRDRLREAYKTSDINAAQASIAAITQEMFSGLEDWVPKLQEILTGFYQGAGVDPAELAESERTGQSKVNTTASQDSVEEFNGRLTTIQSHTYAINETTKTMLSTTQDILQSVMNIESETEGFGERLERMESNLKEVNRSLGDISTRGLKLRN
ncbi:MAG: tape measure protein [Muribaculaceae bacterium]|nr:tape measure protein [Muribaculaceae bacterium]